MKNAQKIDLGLTGYDELFMNEAERKENKLPRIYDIPISEIDDFPDHPFKVKIDEDMDQLVQSIKERGIITPVTLRPKEDGRYEIVSGHRRKKACELAGFETVKAEVREMTRDEAIILMVESNLQRSTILPSEKAFSYKMRLEAMKRQQGERTDLTSVPVGQKLSSREILAENSPDSNTQIQRYIRLTELIPELLDMVDESRIALRPAVELSYLKKEEQSALLEEISYAYAKTLDELRYKEEQIEKDKKDGIKAEARYTTLNDMYELWKDLKRGLKNNTFENYKYMYETFVRNQIGSKTVSSLKKTDIKRFYNYLADERHLKPATIDNIHTVLHQILDMAVDDDYLRNNPSNNVLKELKQSHCFQTEKRRALTRPEQELFLSYLKNTPSASLWYPIFAVLVGTGLRVGEATGLRWCDIDLDEGIINVNHTLVYYDHRTDGSKRGCYFNINTTKTPAGKRQVPMLDFVKEAFLMEKERQELLDIHCEAVVDGYTDFIFLNRFGQPQHQATLNKAIRRIIRDCNDEQFLKDENAKVLLPHFSCHSLRHTFTTRMCEAGVNVKVIQDTLGHKDISTTLNIYTDVTKELRRSEFEGLDSYFKNEYNKANEVL